MAYRGALFPRRQSELDQTSETITDRQIDPLNRMLSRHANINVTVVIGYAGFGTSTLQLLSLGRRTGETGKTGDCHPHAGEQINLMGGSEGNTDVEDSRRRVYTK